MDKHNEIASNILSKIKPAGSDWRGKSLKEYESALANDIRAMELIMSNAEHFVSLPYQQKAMELMKKLSSDASENGLGMQSYHNVYVPDEYGDLLNDGPKMFKSKLDVVDQRRD